MIQFFQNIGQFIKQIIDGLIYIFTWMPKLWSTIGAGVNNLVLLLGSLPRFIAGIGVLVLVSAIVFLILKVFHG